MSVPLDRLSPKPDRSVLSKGDGDSRPVHIEYVSAAALKEDDAKLCNGNRHLAMAPFDVPDKSDPGNGQVRVRADWWREFAKAAPETIVAFTEPLVTPVPPEAWGHEYRHEDPTHLPVARSLADVYHSLHSYRHFSDLVAGNGHTILALNAHDRRTLISWGRSSLLRGTEPTDVEVASWLTANLVDAMQHFLKAHPEGVLVKTGHKSAKNDHPHPLTPLYSSGDVVRHVAASRDMVWDLQCDLRAEHILVLVPWEARIGPHNEVRVIVSNRRVTGISQQQCWADADAKMCAEASSPSAIRRLVARVETEIAPRWLFGDAVLDMWIASPTEFPLIEINPGGAWSSSGSALFHWERDDHILRPSPTLAANSPIVVRLLQPPTISPKSP